MRVLMYGWEFPPHNSGGLGTACHGLTKGLAEHNCDVTLVLPRAFENTDQSHVRVISARDTKVKNLKVVQVDSLLKGYMTEEEYKDRKRVELEFGLSKEKKSIYGKDLWQEVANFRAKAGFIASVEDFDVIHCHDWMTFGAGVEAKRATGKPLVIHVHATEFDRTGGNVNQGVYDLEREGMHAADFIIAVSQFTKDKIVEKYDIPEEKVTVVHNAVEFPDHIYTQPKIKPFDKLVLFLGRLTLQKGPDWFIYTAKRVLEIDPTIKFVVAGSGDMEAFIVDKVAEMGISENVLFTGFLSGPDIDRAYKMASLYVMPSISEPFGITPLEAMRNHTPVLISKQSGVSEVISHCLKVDFWDIDQMADKIINIVNHDSLYHELSENGQREVKKFNWKTPASQCMEVYSKAVQK